MTNKKPELRLSAYIFGPSMLDIDRNSVHMAVAPFSSGRMPHLQLKRSQLER